MHTLARILAPLLLTLGLIAGTAGIAAADVRDYDSLTRDDAIAALRQADADVDQLIDEATVADGYLRSCYAEAADARVRSDVLRAEAHRWESAYTAAVTQAVADAQAAEVTIVDLTAQLGQRDGKISRLKARVAVLKAKLAAARR